MVDFLEVFEAFHGFCLAVVQIAFIEDQGGRNPVGFCSHKESIDEARAGFWADHGNDKKSPVQVGGDDVALFGQVDRTAHIAFRRFSRSTISGGSSSPWNSMTTSSPTAKGLVERSPCRRKRPPARQECTPPVSASRTSYHEPVERKTTPRVCRISIKPLCRGIETPPPNHPVDWTCWPPNHRQPAGRGES